MTVKVIIRGEGLNYEGDTSLPKAAQVLAIISSPNDAPIIPTISTTKRPIKRKGASGIRSVREEIENLSIIPNKEGLPDYWKLSGKSIRVLWILGFAAEADIQELTSSEIARLAKKLRDNVEAKNVMSITDRLQKDGSVVLNSGKYRILQKGLNKLKELGLGKNDST